MDMTIGICTHDRANLLGKTLSSLVDLQVPASVTVELLVVLNACGDDSASVVARLADRLPFAVRWIDEPKPGLSRARNCLLNNAAGQWVCFLDDDVRVDRHWLEQLCPVMRQDDVGVIGGRVRLWWEQVQRPAWMSEFVAGFLSRVDHGDAACPLLRADQIVGANFAVSRKLWTRVGLFREDLGRCGRQLLGSEEIEFVQRAMAAGFVPWYSPATVDHWVDRHRIEDSYLWQVAVGRGQSQVMMKTDLQPIHVVRSIVGHLWLLVRGLVGQWLSILPGQSRCARDQRYLAGIGWGGVKGWWQRRYGRGLAD